jgi:hypothetical protein
VTDRDLDLSGFQAERKVDVPPPPKKKTPTEPKPVPTAKKGKKKKKKQQQPEKEPAVATAEPPVERPTPSRGSTSQASADQPSGPPKRGRKKRVNVSLPVELSLRFTDRAAEEDRYLTDMVLDAYRDHYAAMRDEFDEDLGDSDLPFRPRRRRAAAGRVTHMLYLAAPELAVLDGSADEIGLTRSEFVSLLLERELR